MLQQVSHRGNVFVYLFLVVLTYCFSHHLGGRLSGKLKNDKFVKIRIFEHYIIMDKNVFLQNMIMNFTVWLAGRTALVFVKGTCWMVTIFIFIFVFRCLYKKKNILIERIALENLGHLKCVLGQLYSYFDLVVTITIIITYNEIYYKNIRFKNIR